MYYTYLNTSDHYSVRVSRRFSIRFDHSPRISPVFHKQVYFLLPGLYSYHYHCSTSGVFVALHFSYLFVLFFCREIFRVPQQRLPFVATITTAQCIIIIYVYMAQSAEPVRGGYIRYGFLSVHILWRWRSADGTSRKKRLYGLKSLEPYFCPSAWHTVTYSPVFRALATHTSRRSSVRENKIDSKKSNKYLYVIYIYIYIFTRARVCTRYKKYTQAYIMGGKNPTKFTPTVWK